MFWMIYYWIFKVNEEDDEYVPYSSPSSSAASYNSHEEAPVADVST